MYERCNGPFSSGFVPGMAATHDSQAVTRAIGRDQVRYPYRIQSSKAMSSVQASSEKRPSFQLIA